MRAADDLTALLRAWAQGDRIAANSFMAAVYDDLRRVAGAAPRGPGGGGRRALRARSATWPADGASLRRRVARRRSSGNSRRVGGHGEARLDPRTRVVVPRAPGRSCRSSRPAGVVAAI